MTDDDDDDYAQNLRSAVGMSVWARIKALIRSSDWMKNQALIRSFERLFFDSKRFSYF